MIGWLRGVIREKQAPDIVLDVNGVGYEVAVPMQSFYGLPAIGETISLYSHFVVREDAQLLFGFLTKQERNLFRLLLKANGVGPKLALTILSGLTADQFVDAVTRGDSSTLVKLPGVGKKTAERLIVEMQDRFKDWGRDLFSPAPDFSVAKPERIAAPSAEDDAVGALVSLGYSQAQAQKVVKQISKPDASSEQLIRDALKAML